MVDGLNPNLYLAQAQAAAAQQAAKSSKDEKSKKTDKAKSKVFANAFERSKMELELAKAGFPKEIAGMDLEEAAIFLKDEADIAADQLKEHQTPEMFADYRKKVANFLRYIQKNNFEVIKRERRTRTRSREPQFIITAVNEKLDEMARWLLSTHREAFNMLAKVDEIKGLLIDLLG